jgi:DNA-binding NarL/FixJ family response regulator
VVVATLLEEREEPTVASVLIVDDHALLADGLADALRREGLRAEWVSGPTAEAIVEVAQRLHPDVVLLDLVLGDEIGLSLPLVRPLLEMGARVIVLTGTADTAMLGSCIEAGVCGLLSKSESFDAVLEKVTRASRREKTLLPRERDEMLACLRRRRAQERERHAPFERLSAREREVLGALMDGWSAEEIARSAFVSLATVRSQIRSILEKLGVHSQVAAVALAHRARWEHC